VQGLPGQVEGVGGGGHDRGHRRCQHVGLPDPPGAAGQSVDHVDKFRGGGVVRLGVVVERLRERAKVAASAAVVAVGVHPGFRVTAVRA